MSHNRRRWWQQLLCVVLLISAAAAQSQSIPDSAHQASRVWAGVDAQTTGLHIRDGFVFAVAVIPNERTLRATERRAAAITNQLIHDHLRQLTSLDRDRQGHGTEFESRLLSQAPMSAQTTRLRVQVLQNSRMTGNSDLFRRVVAFPEPDASTQRMLQRLNSESVDQALANLASNWQNQAGLLDALGYHSLALIAEIHLLGLRINTTNLPYPQIDPIAYRIAYSHYLQQGVHVLGDLDDWPGELAVIEAELAYHEADPRRALALVTIACLDPRVNFAQAYRQWTSESSESRSNSGRTWHDNINRSAIDNTQHAMQTVWQSAKQCRGFLIPDHRFSAERPPLFDELERVFDEGMNLQRAIELAHEAIEAAPAYAPGWAYLSGALTAANKHEHARIAARVALLLNPDDNNQLRIYLQRSVNDPDTQDVEIWRRLLQQALLTQQ